MKTIALIGLATLLLAGCGGSGDSGSGMGSPAGSSTEAAATATTDDEGASSGETTEAEAGGASPKGKRASRGGKPSPDTNGGKSRQSPAAKPVTPEEATESSLSKAEFVRQANALCALSKKESTQGLKAYMERNSDRPAKERLEGALKAVYVPSMEVRLIALRQLGAPPSDEAQVEAIWDALEAWVELAKTRGIAAKAAIDRQLIQASTLAKRYGLVQCGSD